MRVLVGTVVAMAAMPTGSAHFLSTMMNARGASHAWSSSSMWSRGRDGHMHQTVQESHYKTMNDGEGGERKIHSEVHCRDGHCEKTVETIVRPGNGPVEAFGQRRPIMVAMHAAMPLRVQALMESIMGPRMDHFKVMPAPPPPPHAPMLEVHLAPPPPFVGGLHAWPNAEGAQVHFVRSPPHFLHLRGAERVPLEAPQMQVTKIDDLTTPLAAMALGGAVLILTGLLAALLGRRHAEAREVSNLAEPLDPETGNAPALPIAPLGPAIAPKAVELPKDIARESAKNFLQGLYSQAQQKAEIAETKAVQEYLACVYSRAVA